MRRRTGAIVGLAMVVATGCAHRAADVTMTGNSLVPAATGTVVLSGKDENNKTLTVTAQHLAPAEDLSAEAVAEGQTAHNYIVWLQPDENTAPITIGVLVPDKNLEARLTTTTSQRKLRIFVTAEGSPTQNAPTGKHLLEASISP